MKLEKLKIERSADIERVFESCGKDRPSFQSSALLTGSKIMSPMECHKPKQKPDYGGFAYYFPKEKKVKIKPMKPARLANSEDRRRKPSRIINLADLAGGKGE